MKQFILVLVMIALHPRLFSQPVDILEKNHDISRKSRKGYLGAVVPNEENGTFQMIFVLKPTARKIPYEI